MGWALVPYLSLIFKGIFVSVLKTSMQISVPVLTHTSINLRKSKCSIGSTNWSKNYTFHSKFLHIFSDFCLVSSTECPDMAAAVRLQETGNVCGGHPWAHIDMDDICVLSN